MKDYLLSQLETLNILSILIMIIFVTALSKANTTKLLKEQSQEFYNEIEEIKQEIWRASRK